MKRVPSLESFGSYIPPNNDMPPAPNIPRTNAVVEMPPVKPPAAPLPAIRPLMGDKAPRWTDETQTECGCDLCQHWIPLVKRLKAQLDDEGKALLEELLNDWEHACLDRDVNAAMLEGEWPGWEAMKDFKPTYKDGE